jgi:hypothetical protein
LRSLSLTDPAIRSARAESRRRQIDRLTARLPHLSSLGFPSLAADLLTLERLADACAEGELTDLGVPDAAASKVLTEAIRRAFGT